MSIIALNDFCIRALLVVDVVVVFFFWSTMLLWC